MSEKILLYILLIPAMLGLAEILHFLKLYITRGKAKCKKCVLFYLCGENCFCSLKAILEECSWQGRNFAEKVVVVDCGIEDIEECLSEANNSGIVFIKPTDLPEFFKKEV